MIEQVRQAPKAPLQGFDKDSPSGQIRPQKTSPFQGDPLVPCERCKAPMRRIEGSKGWFWGCTGYSSGCRHTMNDFQGKPAKPDPANVPRSAQVSQSKEASTASTAGTLKSKPLATELHADAPCPTCHQGKVIGRQVKETGRAFWGCGRFPQCKFFEWTKPIEVAGKS